MPPNLCWPMTSKANVSDMAVEVEPYWEYPIPFCCHRTDSRSGQSDTIVSDVKVQMKQECVIELLHMEAIAPIVVLAAC